MHVPFPSPGVSSAPAGPGRPGAPGAHPDGGYYGWLNLVTSVPGGQQINWAVQNHAVYVADEAALEGSGPRGLRFDLTTSAGLPVPQLAYSMAIARSLKYLDRMHETIALPAGQSVYDALARLMGADNGGGGTKIEDTIAFVAEIRILRDDKREITGYEVDVIDDPKHGDGKPENKKTVYSFDA